MANQHIKRRSTMVTAMRYTTSHQSEQPSSKPTNNKCWRGSGDKGTPYTAGANVSWYNHYGDQYRGSLKNLRRELPYYPAVLLLGAYLEEWDLKRDTYPNIHCSTIHNSQDMEAA